MRCKPLMPFASRISCKPCPHTLVVQGPCPGICHRRLFIKLGPSLRRFEGQFIHGTVGIQQAWELQLARAVQPSYFALSLVYLLHHITDVPVSMLYKRRDEYDV